MHFTHHLTAHMFGVDLRDCASFQDQWGATEKQFQKPGCLISLNNINHESVEMFSNFSVIKLIDYRLIETSNPAETARAGVLMKCKMHPK